MENKQIDWQWAFESLVTRLTKDDFPCGLETKDITELTEEQIKGIKEIAESCIEDCIIK